MQFLTKKLYSILFFIAKRVRIKYQPLVIGITGSVGKTSTKDAVSLVLKSCFSVRSSEKNYNNEIGVPLTILQKDAPGRSVFKWLHIIFSGFGMLLFPRSYPSHVVVELGIDKPGDMDYLMEMVSPDIVIVQQIGEIPVHVEFFRDRDELIQEKAKAVRKLCKGSIAFLNYDDPDVRAMKSLAIEAEANIITFGFQEGADIRATEIHQFNNKKHMGLKSVFNDHGVKHQAQFSHLISKIHLYATLAAYGVARHFQVEPVKALHLLKDFRPPKGRMNVLQGIKQSIVIDDSYNSSPKAAIEALEVLKEFGNDHRKIAVLGDMLELGRFSEEGHRRIGQKVVSCADALIVVGPKSKFTSHEAIQNGMNVSNVHEFDDSEEAGAFIDDMVQQGDVVLVKGSQGMRMERVTKEIMQDPLQAKKLLVRQDVAWLER